MHALEANSYLSNFRRTNSTYSSQVRGGKEVWWSPFWEDWFKLNFDGSKLNSKNASFGFVIRDHVGEVIILGVKALSPCSSFLVVEAWSIHEGVSAALSLGIKNLCIEGDNLVVTNSLTKSWKVPWEINNFVHDVGIALSEFSNVSFNHCFR